MASEPSKQITTRDYLEEIYGRCTTGQIIFVDQVDGHKRVSGKFDVNDLDAAAEHVRQNPFELYVKVNPMDYPKIKARRSSGIGGVKEITEIIGFHYDVDAGKDDRYLDQDKILAALDAMPVPPSAIVLSNGQTGGFHAYWWLETPIVIESEEQRTDLQAISNRWLEELREHAKPGGVDGTANLDRLLRPIGSTRKSGNTVQALRWNPNQRYALDDFRLAPLSTVVETSYQPTSDSDKVIDEYLTAVGENDPAFLLERYAGYSRAGQFLTRPGGLSGSPTCELFEVNGSTGATFKSGACEPFTALNKNGTNGNWYSTARIYVTLNHGGNWKAAAAHCHRYFDRQRKPAPLDDSIIANLNPGRKKTEAPDTTPTIPGKSEVVSQTRESKSRKTQIPELHKFVPFPTSVLPKPFDEFVRQAAKSICCDESFVALPLMTGAAAAIGNSYGLLIKRSWVVPSILWSTVVAESGTGKSAPQRLALRPIHARQKRLLKDYDKAWEQHLRDHEVYMRDLADFKKSKDAMKEPPEAPIEPVCPRVVCNDVTIEALAKRLKDNPRGILCATDELAGWFGGFNRYKGGKSGGEEAKWLEFSNAQTSIVDRSSSPKPLVIEKASVSVTGTIQPGILRKHLTAEHKASGMAARLLFAMPPRIQKRWVEDEIDEDVEDQVTDIFDELFKLEMKVCDDGSLDTNLIRLSHDAKQLFVGFYNRHNGEQQQLDGDLFAAFSKLEEYAARFALVIHCVRYAAGDVASLTQLDVNSMMKGIELCQWFKSEAKRVYSVLSECEVANENRKLLSWIHNNGGSTTPRDFHRAHRSVIDDSTAAETLLQQFVTAGYGEWEPIPTTEAGGRPSRKFSLTSLGQNLENSRDLGGCVPEVSEIPDTTEILGEAWKP